MENIPEFNVVGLKSWDEEAKKKNFYSILSSKEFRDPETFWNTDTGITPELLAVLKDTDKFLDLGCGFGRIARHIIPKVKKYYGVDYSGEMIREAEEFHAGYENVLFFKNNGRDLSLFEDNLFDIVYSCLVFQHMLKNNTFNYIREARRVLKHNGTFFAYNIPRFEKYGGCGFKDEDLKIFDIFSDVKTTKWEYYYNIIAKK